MSMNFVEKKSNILIGFSVPNQLILTFRLIVSFANPILRKFLTKNAKSSAGHQRISIGDITGQPIPLPPLIEQKEIVQRVEKLFKAIDLMRQEYQKASKLCDRLEQATLSKAFRGELVPQDPNDEPASALLERLQAENPTQTKGKGVKSKQRSGEKL